jgi:CRISPR system Cascade subunit CasD
MPSFLILRLIGPMQGWSGHSYEGQRPLVEYPTRSGVLGLLAACLGIARNDAKGLAALSQSLRYAVRSDARAYPPHALVDYHTVQNARESYQGLKSHDTIQTWRGYLCDAAFTVALWLQTDTHWSLEQIAQATRTPRYTPFLGRRSCPITRPLFDRLVEAANTLAAFAQIEPAPCPDETQKPGTTSPVLVSTVYSEEKFEGSPGNFRHQYSKEVRDEPFGLQARQFARRWVHVYTSRGSADVSQ